MLNIGPGSPTGMTFGYGAKFPAKYQNALFSLDWSWGKLYAVHLAARGRDLTRPTKEEFLSGTPLPLTDAIIHPGDGAHVFRHRRAQGAVGPLPRDLHRQRDHRARAAPDDGERRACTSGTGSRPSTQAGPRRAGRGVAAPRRPAIASSAGPPAPRSSTSPSTTWADQALGETDPAKQLEALLALARCTGIDPFHRKPDDPPVDTAHARPSSSRRSRSSTGPP